jgi:hypothetical protein
MFWRRAVFFGLLVFLSSLLAGQVPSQPVVAPVVPGPVVPKPPPIVWEARLADFEEAGYAAALEQHLPSVEETLGRSLRPGRTGAVALKIYSGGGAGLGTPRALVRALVHWLERRGFQRNRIVLVDLYEHRIRDAGLLPPLATRDATFDGLEVRALENGNWWDERWFYDSPLPSRVDILPQEERGQLGRLQALADERKSLLPATLLFDFDFWINLPTASDHPAYGVNAALANATLWNASNTLRFFRSRSAAPGAIAEMAAVPEMRLSWAFTILSLERYQYVGGPGFNSFYSESEPVLWISGDPVLIDALVRERLDTHRIRGGFPLLQPDLPLLRFAESLGLGTADLGRIQWRR